MSVLPNTALMSSHAGVVFLLSGSQVFVMCACLEAVGAKVALHVKNACYACYACLVGKVFAKYLCACESVCAASVSGQETKV